MSVTVAGERVRREVAAGLGAVENDSERVPAALEERGAEPFAEPGVDLRLGHEGTEHVDDLRVASRARRCR